MRPDPAKLETWLEEYSLGEVWEKSVLGGGPHYWHGSIFSPKDKQSKHSQIQYSSRISQK